MCVWGAHNVLPYPLTQSLIHSTTLFLFFKQWTLSRLLLSARATKADSGGDRQANRLLQYNVVSAKRGNVKGALGHRQETKEHSRWRKQHVQRPRGKKMWSNWKKNWLEQTVSLLFLDLPPARTCGLGNYVFWVCHHPKVRQIFWPLGPQTTSSKSSQRWNAPASHPIQNTKNKTTYHKQSEKTSISIQSILRTINQDQKGNQPNRKMGKWEGIHRVENTNGP